MNLSRIINTIRHLKPVQIYGRLYFLYKRKFWSTGQSAQLCKHAAELKNQLLVSSDATLKLTFLNCSKTFSIDKIGWLSGDYPEAPEKLWLYNLNYFLWLFDGQTESFSALNLAAILDWIAKNDSSRSESWEPYPLSIRLRSWIRWCQQHPSLPESTADCIWESIANQCDRLWVDLETHNQANHLLMNLCALFSSTVSLIDWLEEPFENYAQRLQYCLAELNKEIRQQLFADGGHYERSPMYHCEILEAIIEIKKASRILSDQTVLNHALSSSAKRLSELCDDRIPLMRDWLSVMTHPDGKVAQFNDCAMIDGLQRQKKVERPINYLLEDSGYFVRFAEDNYFVIACGEPSPPFQPGHSHCDILSYELSLGGRRCIVDTGCGSYQNEAIRADCRSSAAHNIPLIENTDQSDIWGNFRIGKRAKVTHRAFDPENGFLELEFVDQYEQRFRREVIFAANSIKIRDRMFNRRITGTFCSIIHLAPEVLIQPEKEPGCTCYSIGDKEFSLHTSAKLRIDRYVWYPQFGTSKNAEKLIFSNHETEAIDYVITWQTS